MSSNLTIKRMYVERHRSKDGSSSWIEPPLDDTWSDYTKLSWNLGVLWSDYGLDVLLTRHKANWSISTPGLSFGSRVGPGEFGELWHNLSVLGSGYGLGRASRD